MTLMNTLWMLMLLSACQSVMFLWFQARFSFVVCVFLLNAAFYGVMIAPYTRRIDPSKKDDDFREHDGDDCSMGSSSGVSISDLKEFDPRSLRSISFNAAVHGERGTVVAFMKEIIVHREDIPTLVIGPHVDTWGDQTIATEHLGTVWEEQKARVTARATREDALTLVIDTPCPDGLLSDILLRSGEYDTSVIVIDPSPVPSSDLDYMFYAAGSDISSEALDYYEELGGDEDELLAKLGNDDVLVVHMNSLRDEDVFSIYTVSGDGNNICSKAGEESCSATNTTLSTPPLGISSM